MKILTLAFLFRGDQILLPMKKVGFGAGKWNGYGGNIEEGEEPIDCIIRETEEESGLVIERNACKELGYMDFYFNDKEEWNQRVFIYRIDEFNGEPVETKEMRPQWFDIKDIPYHEMWKGDDIWIPNVLSNKNFTGEVYLDENGTKVISSNIII